MLKGDSEIKDTPVIILSNLDTKQDHDRARELQAADNLVKEKITPEEAFTAAIGAADIAVAERKIRGLQEKGF